MVAESDAANAADALQAKGLRVEDPPEDWLFKVFTDGARVDVLFRPNQRPVDRALLPVARALREQVDWSAVREYVADNDFALAFLHLLDRLGIVTASPTLEA